MIEIEHQDKVSIIWMNRPAIFNAFDEILISELNHACLELNREPVIRIVVLADRGKHFSAGSDLHWEKRASESTEEQNLEVTRKYAKMLRNLSTMNKPTIARIHDAALGSGTRLLAA